MSDFLRYCELIIGPLADWQGGGSLGQAVRVIADGTAQHLRVQFNASKSITGDPNKTDVFITGLSRETRQAIRANLTRVQVVAGYEGSASSAGLVASGALVSALTARQGPEMITRLTLLDGFGGMARAAYARSFAGGTPVASLVRELAAGMPGVQVGRINVRGSLGAKGLQLSGSNTSQLNKLGDVYGFSWSVQNGVFQALMDDTDTSEHFSFASANNLISCVPQLDGPTQRQVGVEVTAKFDARMKPGDRMVVQSTVSPQLNGTYKATAVQLAFDSHGPALLKANGVKL